MPMENSMNHLQDIPFTPLAYMAMAVLLLPLLSFVVLAILPQRWKRPAIALGILFSAINVLLGSYLFSQIWEAEAVHARTQWFSLSLLDKEGPTFTAGILLGNLSVLMVMVVTVVAFLVHLFSLAYMASDKGIKRYYAFLGLFTFAMLGIVLSDNLMLIFCFWELVGLSSYLLIGFWYQKDTAVAAGKKAFLANRIGDLGFLMGLMIFWAYFGTLDLEVLHAFQKEGNWPTGELWLTVAGIGIFFGAVGKSAQFPLQVWLPDAMEGPTPVSALIHAATMVAAGVFLLARVFLLLEVDVLTFIAYTGAITAFMGAIAALYQQDIKKVLAFSTISQLGYMVMGMGVGAYGASLFHLLTHAAFKACLFLSAGAIIHVLHGLEKKLGEDGIYIDPQDMRSMGGLRRYLPTVFITYILSAFALIGLPLFSGFLSKDALLTGAALWGMEQGGAAYLVPLLAFITVALTAYYMGRQLLLVFFGTSRMAPDSDKVAAVWQQSQPLPWTMKLPLWVLALGSTAFVFSLNPVDATHSWVLQGLYATLNSANPLSIGYKQQMSIVAQGHHYHTFISLISVGLAIIGLYLSYRRYGAKKKPFERAAC